MSRGEVGRIAVFRGGVTRSGENRGGFGTLRRPCFAPALFPPRGSWRETAEPSRTFPRPATGVMAAKLPRRRTVVETAGKAACAFPGERGRREKTHFPRTTVSSITRFSAGKWSDCDDRERSFSSVFRHCGWRRNRGYSRCCCGR